MNETAQKFQYFNGVKFTRDDKTGYYLNSTLHIRMHRYVWEFYNGTIPDGYEIHHIDKDRGNNMIENLVMMKSSIHQSMHMYERVHTDEEKTRKHLEEIRPLASAWHSSKEGSEWHKEHYKKCSEKLHEPKEFTCKQCGKKFITTAAGGKFCCNACKSAWRRDAGLDNEKRVCRVCGKEFFSNKYSKTRTCSRSCANKLRNLMEAKHCEALSKMAL